MKLFRASVLIVAAFCASVAWSQAQSARTTPYIDLGHFKGGSTAELQSISDFGVAMGWGDVPVNGGTETRMLGVHLFGPNAGQWFESGVSSDDWTGDGGGISNAGVIAGNILDSNGWSEGYAWTANYAGFYLGKYSDDDGSSAIAINHSGTLIVGNSGKLLQDGTRRVTPVVWTSQVIWKSGKPSLTWEIHALPTGGLEKPGAVFEGVTLNFWGGWGVNDLGQIVGDGWTFDENWNYWEIAVVWNPIRGGKEWEIQRLPMADGVAYNEALGINNLGEIVGDVWESYEFPALYKKDHKTQKWSVSVLPATPNSEPWVSMAWSIDDLGDIVGSCSDENGIARATLWNSHNLSFVKSLGFPGSKSIAYGVNNMGIAVGGYWNTVDQNGNPVSPEQAVAVPIR
jgi:uncharacterized membrane protein